MAIGLTPGLGVSSVGVDKGIGGGGHTPRWIVGFEHAGGDPGAIHQQQQLVGEEVGVTQTGLAGSVSSVGADTLFSIPATLFGGEVSGG